MKHLKSFWITVCGVALALNFYTCSKQPTRAIQFLFDVSGTTIEHRQQYLDIFDKVLQSLNGGDRIGADIITADSYSNAIQIFDKEFPVSSVLKNEILVKKARKEMAAAISNRLEDVVNNSRARSTDIFGAIQNSQRFFTRYQAYDERYLIILSDMIQENNQYNFNGNAFNQAKISTIIQELRNKQLLPDLTGVRIYVAGAKSSNSNTIHVIKDFWLSYFSACRAIAEEQNYGSSFLGFP